MTTLAADPATDPDPVLDPPRVAETLGVCLDTAMTLIRKGELRAARVGRGRGQWRVRRSWINEYLDRASEAAPPP
jgi:excisionase family DNA binding protein